MFYPCVVEIPEPASAKQGVVVLTPAESRRLLAKGIVALPEVQRAYRTGRVAVMAGGTTSFVLEELTGEKIEPYHFSMGMSAAGMLTKSLERGRVNGRVFQAGQMVDMPYPDFVKTMEKGDVIVKGANAVDPAGNAGVLMCNENGGAISGFFGPAFARGIPVIMPVGLEKSIASVPEAASGWGQLTLDYAMGVHVGLASLTSALVVTEIQALAVLAGVAVRHVASGGIAGSEGSVVLLLEGPDENFRQAITLIESLKGEPPVEVPEHEFS